MYTILYYTILYIHNKGSIAVHMTCYENVNKVMGLKAANAFWNPLYYDPTKRTITKKLLFTDERELQAELRALIWTAIATKRTLILPNILASETVGTVDLYQNNALWPGFRLAYIKPGIDVDIVEPAFYWRIQRDYLNYTNEDSQVTSGYHQGIPKPFVLPIKNDESLESLVSKVSKLSHPRIILHVIPKSSYTDSSSLIDKTTFNKLNLWADDSVGIFDEFDVELSRYGRLNSPTLSRKYRSGKYSGKYFLENTRVCRKIFAPMRGNRSCFDKCD